MGSACSNCTSGETESEINTVSRIFLLSKLSKVRPNLWFRPLASRLQLLYHHQLIHMVSRLVAISTIMGTESIKTC